jgi:hypothetical protein
MDTTRCKARVYESGSWGSFHPHQCNHKLWKDGYCKTHHPETVKIRQVAKEKRWEEEDEKRRANNPLLLLQKANQQIEELERQLKSSNSIREAEKKILIEKIEENTVLKAKIKLLKERIDAYEPASRVKERAAWRDMK